MSKLGSLLREMFLPYPSGPDLALRYDAWDVPDEPALCWACDPGAVRRVLRAGGPTRVALECRRCRPGAR